MVTLRHIHEMQIARLKRSREAFGVCRIPALSLPVVGTLWILSRAPECGALQTLRATWYRLRHHAEDSRALPRLLVLIAAAFACLLTARASDWPQFLGPTRNGIYAGTDLAEAWPKDGPPVVWQKKVGQGFSGPVVASGKLILFHRLDAKETVECLDAQTGKSLWMFDYPTAYRDDFGFDEGPRATPAIADGRAYTYG